MASVDIFNNLTPSSLRSESPLTLTSETTLISPETLSPMRVDSPIVVSAETPVSSLTIDDSGINEADTSAIGNNSAGANCEPLTMNDIKLFESLDLDGSDDEKKAAAMEGALEENDSMLSNVNQTCKICKEKLNVPRVLSCLHVFCESCIDSIIAEEKNEMVSAVSTIDCPECKQVTVVSGTAASLHADYVYTNILDLSVIEPGSLQCTSCKSAEVAISRCNDCANFLCACCDNAHKYMRCFENHCVVVLDELRVSDEKFAIHKPLFCKIHPSENLKYYCFKCQIPVCNDCVTGDHKGSEHHYELIGEAEKRMRNDIEDLMTNAKCKISYCDDASFTLGNALTELQQQHDTAHNQIAETYKRLKKCLDDCRDHSLKELDKLHSERELKVMDLMQTVENSIEKTETACKFTNKVLQSANGAEFLCLKRLISTQFFNLISNTPKIDVNFALEFTSKPEKIEQAIQDSFGKFRTESSPPSPKESTPPPTLPGMPPALTKSNIPMNSSQGALTGSVTASSPISLPTSMQSSFDGDMSALNSNFIIPSNAIVSEAMPTTQANLPPTHNPIANVSVPSVGAPSNPPNMPVMSSIAEYNLHRLANLAESTDMPDGIVPPTNPSPAPQFTLADLISNHGAFSNNLQALCKLGGYNSNDLTANSVVGHSNDRVSMMSDYSMASSTSPVGTINSIADSINGLNGLAGNNLSITGRAKAQPMHIRYKFGSLGPSRVQFNSPHGFCLGVDEEIIVADTNNHRIEVFEKDGTFKMQFGVPGKEEGQLWYPRKVAVMRSNSKFVVCDRGNERSRMQIFTKNGHFIKKIAIRYIDIVAGLAVTNEGHIVAVDSVSPTVFVISEDGDLVHWFDCSDHMREPSDIAISGTDFYVCDFKGHCVVVFGQDGSFKYRIGNEKITCFPNGIDISDAGDILIGDSHGNRFHVACFSREGVLQSEFECPHVKVSRCCGLKITSEGYVVTLAKNNHHVLVLNTLYIQ